MSVPIPTRCTGSLKPLFPPPPERRSTLIHDIEAMPFTLTVRVTGYDGLPTAWIARLEQKLTEFFFQAPGYVNGVMTCCARLSGDAGMQARRCQIFLFSLRVIIAPSLNFSMEFVY